MIDVKRRSALALDCGCTNFGFALANELIPTAALFLRVLPVFRTHFECKYLSTVCIFAFVQFG